MNLIKDLLTVKKNPMNYENISFFFFFIELTVALQWDVISDSGSHMRQDLCYDATSAGKHH